MLDKKSFESIYIENYGLSDLELGDAAMIKLYLMGSEDGVQTTNWNQEAEELITDLKKVALQFIDTYDEWESEMHREYVNKWIKKRSATLSDKSYSPGMVSFIEDVKNVALNGIGQRMMS